MYAISHAATALVLKKKYPTIGLWPLLISVQVVEVLWVVLTYLGIEHADIIGDKVHLDFLPFSHSVFSGLALAVMTWGVIHYGFKQPKFALAIAIGIFSHVVLDIIQHEQDITLLPIAWGPRLGFGLANWPLANLIIELLYGVLCWWIFDGGIALLAGIVIFNLLDAPLMFPQPGSGAMLNQHPMLLPTIILVQIVTSWLVVWWLARPRQTTRLTPAIQAQ